MTPTGAPEHPLHRLLPRLGTEEEFAALRRLLADCGFNNQEICRRLEIPSIVGFKARCDGRTAAAAIQRPIDVLIRLFMDGEFVPQETVESKLPGGLAVLDSLALLARATERPGEVFAAISMYPAGGTLMMAGDRAGTPDGSRYWLPADVVYPGIVENTRNFLASLPQTPCVALLDVGTGSGIAALMASQYARHAWGTDIAGRSVRFAEFNRRLNQIGNVTMVEGDLYEPVRGLTFDRIVTHPPYVPAPRTELIFRDGGDDGEQILRRIIEGLPEYLRTGGRFYTLVLGADLEEETFEDRIRKWLGPQQPEFDLVMVSHSLRPPGEFVANSLVASKIPIENLKYWSETWVRRKAQFLFLGSILIRRHDGSRPAVTARVQKGDSFRPEYQDWLLDWETDCLDPSARAFLLDCHPSIAPGVELHVLHRLHEGRFSPEAFGLEAKEPFMTDLRCGRSMVALISACDGTLTWREQLRRAQQEGSIGAETEEDEFARILGMLVSQGILRVSERPLPVIGGRAQTD